MSATLLRIADQLLCTPLLVTPDKAGIILSVLGGRIGIEETSLSRFEGRPYAEDEPGKFRGRPYNVTPEGVAVITITGSLVSRGAWIGADSGLTSYEGIQHQLKTARADSKVRTAILDMHTPGGQALLCFETAAMVRQLSAEKRTIAVVNGMAASGGYAIASGASEIVTTEIGVCGSIGVLYIHTDMSGKMEKEGLKPTIFQAGAHKGDGNPFQALSAQVSADMQREVEQLYEVFLKTVALGRGKRLTIDAARATEARTPMGVEAVSMGLADRVGTFEDVLAELQTSTRAPAPGRSTSMKGKTMENTQGAPAADAGISQADHQAAVTAAEQKGATTERTRLATILGSDGVKGDSGRMIAAIDLAVKAPTMSATDVTAFVSANVAAAPAASASAASAVLAKLDKAAEGVASRPSTDGTAGAAAPTKATTPEGWKAEYAASAELQAEYPSVESYVAYQKRQSVKAA